MKSKRGNMMVRGTWPIGQRIVAVREMTAAELRHEGWFPRLHEQALAIELELGVLYAARDEEGNGPGAMFGRDGAGALVALFPPDYEGVTEERAPSLAQERLNDCFTRDSIEEDEWFAQERLEQARVNDLHNQAADEAALRAGGGLHLRPAGRRSQTAKKGRKP